MALIAFSNNKAIGVDIEFIDPAIDFDELVPKIFTPQECKVFQQTLLGDKRASFFLGWTCKEAFVKATGKGLSFPLMAFEVSLNPEVEQGLKKVPAGSNFEEWEIKSFFPASDYIAAIATSFSPESIKFYSWN